MFFCHFRKKDEFCGLLFAFLDVVDTLPECGLLIEEKNWLPEEQILSFES